MLVVILVFSAITVLRGQPAELNRTFWNATLSDSTQLRLTYSQKGNRFKLYSRPGSSKAVLGNKYILARLARKVENHSIEISGKVNYRNDTAYLQGTYRSLTSERDFSGFIYGKALNAKVGQNSLQGKLTEQYQPARDYHAIARAAIDTSRCYLFDPAILKGEAWISFEEKVLRLSSVVADDYEFENMYNLNAQNLPFSHYGIRLNKPPKKAGGSRNDAPTSKFELKKINTNTVLFSVRTFSASADEIQPYIDTLRNLKIDNLIIDLRGNTGGTIASALPLARFLFKDTLYGGVFITQKYFKTHDQLPSVDAYKHFDIFSEASFELIIKGIHTTEGLCLVVYPEKYPFPGKVYILTNGSTGSTCEPLVYGLKHSKRATVVGEKTYGGMLNGEQFNITKNFRLWVPTADYYTSDGKKIDRVGVMPDVVCKSEEALEKTLGLIN